MNTNLALITLGILGILLSLVYGAYACYKTKDKLITSIFPMLNFLCYTGLIFIGHLLPPTVVPTIEAHPMDETKALDFSAIDLPGLVVDLPEEYQAISKDSINQTFLMGYFDNDTLRLKFDLMMQ